MARERIEGEISSREWAESQVSRMAETYGEVIDYWKNLPRRTKLKLATSFLVPATLGVVSAVGVWRFREGRIELPVVSPAEGKETTLEVSQAQVEPARIFIPREIEERSEVLIKMPVEIKVSDDWDEEEREMLRENTIVGLERVKDILGPPPQDIKEKTLFLAKLRERRAGFAKDEQGNLWFFIAHPEDLRGLFHEVGHLWEIPPYGPGWSEGLAEFVSYQACGSWLEGAPLTAPKEEERKMEKWETSYYHYTLAGHAWAKLEQENPGFIKKWISWYHQELDAGKSPIRAEAVAAGTEIWEGFPAWVESQEILNIPFDYTVQEGDTLTEIAQFYDTTVEELTQVNKIEAPNSIYEGQKIVILRESKQIK